MKFISFLERQKMNFKSHMDTEKVCCVMRGLPGSGKSHKVRDLISKFGGDDGHVFSADKFFNRLVEQEYLKKLGRKPDEEEIKEGYKKIWRPSLLGVAHRKCLEDFKAAVDLGITPVIVDNTNTTKSQIQKYFEYAEENGYRVRIEEPDSPWWLEARGDLGNTKLKYSEKLQKLLKELLKHGSHGVPEEVLVRLIDSTWQNTPYTGKYVTFDQIFKDD